MTLDSSWLVFLTVSIPTSILIVKITFLGTIFFRYRINAVLAYIAFLLVSSYPLSYLTSSVSDWTQKNVDDIKWNDTSVSWLGHTAGEKIANILYLERLTFNMMNIIELFLFIWLLREISKINR